MTSILIVAAVAAGLLLGWLLHAHLRPRRIHHYGKGQAFVGTKLGEPENVVVMSEPNHPVGSSGTADLRRKIGYLDEQIASMLKSERRHRINLTGPLVKAMHEKARLGLRVSAIECRATP
jgi:hypothetical protein